MRESYWQRDGGWRDEWHETSLPRSVDLAVLGGGLSGLATAIALRERNPGAEIVLLEAERVGFGASGRNAGFLSPLAAPVWLLGAERSPDQAWAIAQLNRDVHATARWIGEHIDDTELAPGRLSLETTGRISAWGLAEFAAALETTGLAFRLSMQPQLALEMDAYTMHPYKLVRGLARHADRIGVRVRERARVQALERSSSGARVRLLNGGELTATTVIVCTNAYTSAIDTGERIPAVGIHSFMFASAPLATALPRRGEFTVEVNRAQVFHRMHRDRLLYGGIDQVLAPSGGDYALPRSVQARLDKHVARTFAGRAIPPAEGWSGMFHATANGLPIIRRSTKHPAIVFNVGYGGTGVSLALACGRIAAGIAAGSFATRDDERLAEVIRDTRISVRDTARTLARLLRRLARPT